MFDVIIAGSGFGGATAARVLAEKGKKVLVLEKRAHIGGNMYDKMDKNGVPVHIYGPHIFHTNDADVYSFINRFGSWDDYDHRVLGSIDGKLVPIPFNFKSLETLLPEKAEALKQELIKAYPNSKSVSVNELKNHSDKMLKELGEFVFEKVFLHYTAKQWGIPASEVDVSVLNRVPVVLSYDDRYFHDKYQCMPRDGYTKIFDNLLSHENITVKTSVSALSLVSIKDGKIYFEGKPFEGKYIFTGAADELFENRFGNLPYRSVNMAFEEHDVKFYQPASVVNYPNEHKFTRITEFKHFYGGRGEATTILKEFPIPHEPEKGTIPYYVITNAENAALYKKYKELADSVKNLVLLGRLAEYRYYNMDAVIARALNVCAD